MSRPRRSLPVKDYGENEDCEHDSSDESNFFIIPVAFPDPSEVARTRVLITQHTSECALIEARQEECKKTLEELEAQLQVSRQALFRMQASIAPIKRLPFDVLALIFEIHVHQHCSSPWVPMHVSRTWRAVAFATKNLWARISLRPLDLTKKKRRMDRFEYDTGELCFNGDHLTRALKRAGRTPLNLTISQRQWKLNRNEVAIQDGLELVDWLSPQTVNIRLRTLTVRNYAVEWQQNNRLERLQFSSLESFTLKEDYPAIIKKVVEEARSLRSLRVPPKSLHDMEAYRGWRVLKDLQINDNNSTDARDTAVIRKILAATTCLASLSIPGTALSASGTDEPPRTHVPSLTNLHMWGWFTYWPIDCPNLTHLELRDGAIGELEAGTIRLPHLVELSYTLYFEDRYCLHVFNLPSLHKLILHCGFDKVKNTRLIKRIWPVSVSNSGATKSVSNIEPRIFVFDQPCVNLKVLAHALTVRKQLNEIQLGQAEVPLEFFNILLTLRKMKRSTKFEATDLVRPPAWSSGCPTLQRLIVTNCLSFRSEQEYRVLERKVNALVAARVKAGIPHEQLSIRFSAINSVGYKEMVKVAPNTEMV